jgi:hypothetical protein
MKLRLLAKDENSGKAGCLSVYLAEDGSLVVQGHLLDADTGQSAQRAAGRGSGTYRPDDRARGA